VTSAERRQNHRHHFPHAVEPWDPAKVRCASCGQRPPESVLKAIHNETLNRRIRRSIRQSWLAMEPEA
jgi:hypothetical protein